MGVTDVLCGCGEPLHYSSIAAQRDVERLVADFGPEITVSSPVGSWRVPRHYIALHGLKERELPVLAAQYGWAKA